MESTPGPFLTRNRAKRVIHGERAVIPFEVALGGTSRPGACRSAIEAEGTDIDLVRRAQDGDERAFESLAEVHHARLFRVAYGILRDRHLAEDATQQALLDIWRNIPRLRDASKFEAWSYRLLVNACYDEARRRPTWVPSDSLTPGNVPISRDATGPVIARDELSRALQSLSLEHRAVLVLRYLMDLSPHEIGVALSIPRRTVYSRLQRAMDSVRGVLEAEARPPGHPPVHQEASR